MKCLGYTRFVAQGGDWGNAVAEQVALQVAPELIGIHADMPANVPADVAKALQFGQLPPSGLSADKRGAWDERDFFYDHGLGYAQEMANRPQTLYGIADSPIGLAAGMLDHDARSQALIARVFDGQAEGLTRNDILYNITLYWLTNTAVSSARFYWESKLAFFAPKGMPIPAAVSAFPDEIYAVPKSWTEKAYSKLIYHNRLPRGGHFATWEQPALFSEEIRAAFPITALVAEGTARTTRAVFPRQTRQERAPIALWEKWGREMSADSKAQLVALERPPLAGAEQRLKELGITIPAPPEPFGTYVEAVQTGNLLFLTGMLPTEGREAKFIGRVGAELNVEAGCKAAHLAALNVLAVAREHLGSLDRVTRIVRLGVSVATTGDFRNQPKVAGAASELLQDVFGKDKNPCRLVYGVASLPLGTPVELEVIFEVAV